MRKSLVSLSFMTLAATGPLAGQIVIERVDRPVKAKSAQQEESPHDALFYKAFYLYRGENKFEQAIELFKAYLEKAPRSRLAAVAARNTLNLLYRVNRMDEADAFRERFAGLLARGPRGPREGRVGREGRGRRERAGREGRGRTDRPVRGRGGDRGPRAGRRDPAARLRMIEERLQTLEKNLEKAREGGNGEEIERLERRLENLKRAYEEVKKGGGRDRARGREGRGRRGGFGRGMKPLTEMSKEELREHVDRMASMIERFAERMADMGQEERAEKMKKAFEKYRSLIEAGKLEEAMEARRKLFARRR